MAPEENYAAQCAFTPYTSMVNVMGLPAVSVPVLTDDDGLSWSVQLIGRAGTEGALLQLAAQILGSRDTKSGSVLVEQCQVLGGKVADQDVRHDNLLDIGGYHPQLA